MNPPRPPRWLLVRIPLALLLVTAGCGVSGDGAGRCAPPPAADVRTVPGWLGYLAAHREDVALVVDDGRGGRIEHRAEEVQAMASASKALNLVGYARAVATGVVRPDDPVRVGDWERWSVLGQESAHAAALDHLGIPRDGARARNPDRTVTLEQVANQMIIWSDNAAPDYLRSVLGDRMLLDAARSVGWRDAELPSTTGFLVSFFTPELIAPNADRATLRATEWSLARRYVAEPAFRAEVNSRPGPNLAAEARIAEHGPGGTARQLAALWSAIGRGGFPGDERARAIAEQGPSREAGVLGSGAKGGSLLGVLTRGVEVRRQDGTVGVAALLVRRMSAATTKLAAGPDSGFDDLLLDAVTDPAVTATLRCQFPAG